MGRAPALSQTAPTYLTGAYALSGDPMIDRMIKLERALKENGAAL